MAGAAAGAAAMEAAIRIAEKALDQISEYHYENEAVIAWWNDWKARDQRAHIEKTFNNGRFSRERRTFGIVNGRWYCCLTQNACRAKGQPLDD